MSYNGISKITATNTDELRAAFMKVAELRKTGVKQPISIVLRGGEYFISDTIVINETVSAVTVEAFADEDVVFSGSRRITGFKETEYNGVRCLGAYIPDVKKGDWNFTDLYVDGLRADLTRYPITGGLHKTDIENKEGRLFDGSQWFVADPDDLKNISNITDSIVSFCHYWIDEHSPVRSYDSETGKLTLEYKTRFNIVGDIEYYLENVPRYFKESNQWYLDRSKGMLYYIPRCSSQTADSIVVHAPVVSKLFEIKGDAEFGQKVSNVRFRDVTFAYTRGDYASGLGVHGEKDSIPYASDAQAVSNADGSVSFEGAHCCSVENCRMLNFGVHGFIIKEGCDGIRIENTLIYDGGGGGIKIIGSPSNKEIWGRTYGNKITGNIIRRCGRRYLSACGILIMHSYENEISHNEISDLLYTGISCGWVWGYTASVTRDNIISKNHIYNLGQGLLSDMGGVYLLGLQPGTVVSGNLIHDIKSREYGGWALYTDEGSSYITLENNICYNTSDNSYHQHYGSMNTVRNNIFAFSKGEMIRVSRTEDHLSIIFENNIIYTDGSPVYGLGEAHFRDGRVASEKNIVWSPAQSEPVFHKGWGEGTLTLADMQRYGMEKDTVIADPLFMDAANYNFKLKSESPALALGFKPIDISDVGPKEISNKLK